MFRAIPTHGVFQQYRPKAAIPLWQSRRQSELDSRDPTKKGGVSIGAVGTDAFEIEIAGRRFEATPHFRAPYDPRGLRLRS